MLIISCSFKIKIEVLHGSEWTSRRGSLGAVRYLLTMIHALGVESDFGISETILMMIMPVLVAAFLIWYSKRAESLGWSR